MQKRRLSKLARIVFGALDGCGKPAQHSPVIFSSVMGEIQRTQGILEAIATDTPVSPAAFSLSVHNSVGGLWSLLRDNRSPMISLSPTGGSPVGALLEAAGILAEGVFRSVSVVFYAEANPEFYAPYLTGPEAPYAIALQLVEPLTMSGPDSIVVELEMLLSQPAETLWQTDIDLLKLLTAEQDSLLIGEPQATWRLERQG